MQGVVAKLARAHQVVQVLERANVLGKSLGGGSQFLFGLVKLSILDQRPSEIQPAFNLAFVKGLALMERGESRLELTQEQSCISEIVPALPVGRCRSDNHFIRFSGRGRIPEKLSDISAISRSRQAAV